MLRYFTTIEKYQYMVISLPYSSEQNSGIVQDVEFTKSRLRQNTNSMRILKKGIFE